MNRKKSVSQAFTELKYAFQAKKQKMSDAEKQKAEAQSQRQFYYDKILKFEKSLAQNFDTLMQHELKEKSSRLKDLLDKFEIKCLSLGCLDSTGATTSDDERIDELCMSMQSKIAQKIDDLEKEAKCNAQMISDDQSKSEQGAKCAQQGNAPNNANEMQEQTNKKRKMQISYSKFAGNIFQWRSFEKKFKLSIKVR